MAKTLENPFEITREELLDLAASKLLDTYETSWTEYAESQICEQVKRLFEVGIAKRIDGFLDAEMKKILGAEIVPVNIWGEREGSPTTIRAELAKRAREFWNVRVDREGRESVYGGTERSKVLMEQILKDTFAAAVKENAEIIVAEFKTALKADVTKLVAEHIEKLIPGRRI